MKYLPMLCKLGDKQDLAKKDYIFEVKVDGTRAVLHANKEIILINRRNRNITHRYPEFGFRKNIKAKSAIIDGEVVCYNEEGLPDFNLLQKREQLEKRYLIEIRAEQIPATFIAFDILEKDGKKLIKLPLKKRKQILKQTIVPGPRLELMVFTENGKKIWKEIRKLNLEGVVAKKLDSEYLPDKRTRDWIKIKNMKTIDCVIVGYTKEIRQISALALACYSNKKLRYVGRVGTGFTSGFIKYLLPKLEKLKTGRQIVEYKGKHKINWVKPMLVAEIKYLQITKDKILRVPVFLRLREDKPPKDCILEEQI